MNTLTIRFGSTGLLVYLGLGILYHLISSDIPFSWADPWLYITMAIWPVFIIGWILAIFFVCFIGFVTYDVYFKPTPSIKKISGFKQRREERRRAAAKATPSQRD
jgi:hypothetical protein